MSSDPIADINQAMEAAVAAQEAGDYTTALSKMETAYMRISVLPKSEFENERLEWDLAGIQSLIDYLKKRANAQTTSGQPRTTLIRPNDIIYQRG